MKTHPFELRVMPDRDGSLALDLWEMPPNDSRGKKGRHGRRLSRISGWHLRLAQGSVNRALESAGYRPSLLKRTRRAPFRLPDEWGIRLDLLFRGIARLRKRTRIEDVIFGIGGMSREETYYWHAKVTKDNGTTAMDGIRALRMLLGGK